MTIDRSKKLTFIALAAVVLSFLAGLLFLQQEPARYVTAEALHNSVVSGGDFLLRMQNPDGSYKYKYYPETDNYSRAYNILRHTGVVYSLLLLYEFSHEPRYLESAEKGVGFLMQHIEQIDDDTSYVFFNNKAKLGGAALAVIALAKLETLQGTGEYLDTIRDLTNFILLMQEDTGKFTSFYIYDGKHHSPTDSYIYPGEAMLALVRAYKLLEDEVYVTALEKAYDYYSHAFVQDLRPGSTSWTSTAFVELYGISPRREYADFVFAMEDQLVSLQYLDKAPKREFLGGYGPGEPSVNAGSRTEGVCDAYLLAKQLGDRERMERYKKSMLLAVNFLTQLQHTSENTAGYPDPAEAIGAFCHRFGSTVARIDYTQHCISAMIKALTYLRPEEITIEQYVVQW